VTRRFFYWVPAVGEPVAMIHVVDELLASYFPGKTVLYSSWRELDAILFSILKYGQTVAMEYWPSELLLPICSRRFNKGMVRAAGNPYYEFLAAAVVPHRPFVSAPARPLQRCRPHLEPLL